MTNPDPEVLIIEGNPAGLAQMGRAVISSNKKGKGELPNIALRRNKQKIDKTHVAEYRKVCGFKKGEQIPLTYPHMLVFGLQMEMMLQEDFPYPVMGLVHVANSAIQHQSISYSDSLDAQCRFAELKDHDKGVIITIVNEIFRNDELVWSGESQMLRRRSLGKEDKSEDKKKDVAKAEPISNSYDQWSLAGNLGRQYGSVSGDRNPIHLFSVSAKLFGFQRQIIHGMWTKARCAAALEDSIGGRNASISVDFKLPIFLPGKINFYNQHNDKGSSQENWYIEVWDKKGEKPHLKGLVAILD